MHSKQKNLKAVYPWRKMQSLNVLVILKCENKTSVHAVQYKGQPASILTFCSCFKNSYTGYFVLIFCGTHNILFL